LLDRLLSESLSKSEAGRDDRKREQGWKLLYALPVMLLRPTKHGNAQGKREWARRFDWFGAGRWQELIAEAADSAVGRKPRIMAGSEGPRPANGTDPGVRQAERLVSVGELSKAASRLVSDPPTPADSATLGKLRALHPSPTQPFHFPPDVPLEGWLTSGGQSQDTQGEGQGGAARGTASIRDSLATALRTAPRRSAPGPSGWRYEHVRALFEELLDSPHSDIIDQFALDMLDGNVPAAVHVALQAAWLSALAKPDGAARPIAVGDVLRRWVTRALMIRHKDAVRDHLGIAQFAVGTRAGAEKLVRSVDTVLTRRADGGPTGKAVIAFDASNAFNSANRQRIFDELQAHFPGMLPFFRLLYGTDAPLWFRLDGEPPATVYSRQGVQQGDAAGPFLFSLGLKPALDQIALEL
jgi:hypothetical protein